MNDKIKEAYKKHLSQPSTEKTNTTTIKGYDFNKPFDFDSYMGNLPHMGIQSSHMHRAIEIINDMLLWRGENGERVHKYLSFTSSASSSGLREMIAYLAEHKLIDSIVTTAGAIEEDILKTHQPHISGNFVTDDRKLFNDGWNRVGNIFCANDAYYWFEDFLTPILAEMKRRQREEGMVWSPSSTIKLWGDHLDDKNSFVCQAARNNIPIYAPAFLDGAIGDALYFDSFKDPYPLVIDYVTDTKKIITDMIEAPQKGAICLGSSVPKHFVLNSSAMMGGLNHAVFITTAQEFDASDGGAPPSEAITWGKINENCKSIKLVSETTIAFPLIMAQTFVKYKLGKLIRK